MRKLMHSGPNIIPGLSPTEAPGRAHCKSNRKWTRCESQENLQLVHNMNQYKDLLAITATCSLSKSWECNCDSQTPCNWLNCVLMSLISGLSQWLHDWWYKSPLRDQARSEGSYFPIPSFYRSTWNAQRWQKYSP